MAVATGKDDVIINKSFFPSRKLTNCNVVLPSSIIILSPSSIKSAANFAIFLFSLSLCVILTEIFSSLVYESNLSAPP